MRVLVCGGRHFNDYSAVKRALNGLDVLAVIHGAARGADALADLWALSNAVPVERFPADWNKHGKAAGPIRNQQMLDEGKPDLVVAFPGGTGTADMVRRARKADIEVREVA